MFERLAPFLQEYIFSQGWEELKDTQVKSCKCIFDTNNNILISSGTASGKTEAAFLPILTDIYNNPCQGVSVLYISPLKALINDQYNRIEDLIKESNVTLMKWHGDVYSYKKDLSFAENTILQITPESLEALLTKKTDMAKTAFKDLRYIIIDEIHYFMSSIRGEQLRCLIDRLQILTDNIPRRIGLSATIGNITVAAKWLSENTNKKCSIIADSSKKKMKLSINLFDLNQKSEEELYNYIFDESYNNRNIIFTNSRKDVEEIAHNITNLCLEKNIENRYYTHHASISKTLKEDLERKMKSSNEPISTISTTTLELGIDIGSLDKIIQIGCPYKVSSFLQRLGRTGRRTGLSCIDFVIINKQNETPKSFLESFNLDFFLTLAIIETYKDEKWVEEPKTKLKPFSLLFHQTLVFLYSNGETTQQDLAKIMLSLSPFKYINLDSYKELLHSMKDNDYISLTEDRKILLGINGERLVNNFRFFALFETKPEYIVKTNTEIIGSTTQKQKVGSNFWLSGKCWRTLSVDDKNLSILVEYNHNNDGINKWSSDGYFIVADKLFKKVQELLLNDYIPPYISGDTLKYFIDCKKIFQKEYPNNFHTIDKTNFTYFPWLGFESFNKLEYLLSTKDINYDIIICNNLKFALKIKDISVQDFNNILTQNNDLTGNILKYLPIEGKYNENIPSDLLIEQAIFEYDLFISQ